MSTAPPDAVDQPHTVGKQNMGAEHLAEGERILVLAPTGRDAPLACDALQRAGMAATIVRDVQQLCREIVIGAGVILVAEEALNPDRLEELTATLNQQEPWSDIPFIVLTTNSGQPLRGSAFFVETLDQRANITLLERPLQVSTLVSATQAALRARRRQYQVRDLLQQLERGVRQRDEFLAMLGHELRNPLAAISYSVQVLNQIGSPDATAVQARGVVERQTNQLARLVDDLLDVSRVTQGKIHLNRQPVDINEIARRSVQALEAAVASQQHEVTLSTEDTPVMVAGDPARLEQVLTNLLTNAIKYTPAGGSIQVTVARIKEEVGIRVRDNGIGIAPELLSRVFDLFAQAERALDRSQGGLGIGLTLVNSLVNMHGGSVSVTSEGIGKGSEFAVCLPLLAAIAEVTQDPEVELTKVSPTPTNLGHLPLYEREIRTSDHIGKKPAVASTESPENEPLHILVVEDNADSRQLLQLILQMEGHRVEVAEDGAQGIEKALSIHPALALVDIGLPGLNGYQVAEQLRAALGNSIYLIALTGYGQPQDRERTREAGFDMHLVKPVDPDQLAQALVEASNAMAASRS